MHCDIQGHAVQFGNQIICLSVALSHWFSPFLASSAWLLTHSLTTTCDKCNTRWFDVVKVTKHDCHSNLMDVWCVGHVITDSYVAESIYPALK